MSELPPTMTTFDLEAAVRQRYGKAAQVREAALCCPVSYLLEVIPTEVIERDYRLTTYAGPVSKPGDCC